MENKKQMIDQTETKNEPRSAYLLAEGYEPVIGLTVPVGTSNKDLGVNDQEPKNAENYAYTNEVFYKLAERFMPGPLTVILPKRDCIPYATTGGLDTVAVRMPNHPTALALIAVLFGRRRKESQ